jgi:hypothetical protein
LHSDLHAHEGNRDEPLVSLAPVEDPDTERPAHTHEKD